MITWIKNLFKAGVNENAVLFGVSPPEGHYFHVRQDSDGDWWVHIIRDGGSSVCAAYDWLLPVGTAKFKIKRAAKLALKRFNGMNKVHKLEGNYPPKDTRNL